MKKRVPEYAEPVLLPQVSAWESLADVERYARACMDVCGLGDWALVWDRAIRRLGCCKMSRRTLSFSRYYVEAYLPRDQESIRRTILHELAHALAWEKHRDRGHGEAWRYWCAVLGIPGEKSVCRCDDFAPPERSAQEPKYALCHAETGEIYRYYYRKPRLSARKLRFCYLPGKKEATFGKLRIVSLLPEAE